MRRRARRQRSEDAADQEGRVLTILEHLLELRKRLIIAASALLISTLGSLVFTQWFLRWLTAPARNEVEDIQIIFTEPLEYWGTYFRVALLSGIALSMPVILYQVMAFIGPGLTKQEKRWLYPIILGASFAFVGGGRPSPTTSSCRRPSGSFSASAAT